MAKTTKKTRGARQGSSRKKASPKTRRPPVRSKKSRRPALHGHRSKLREALHQNENEPKTTGKVKRHLQGSSRKKASPRTSRPSGKSKRSKRPVLYGHYHRLQEALKRYDHQAEEDQESRQRPTTSPSYWGSCWGS